MRNRIGVVVLATLASTTLLSACGSIRTDGPLVLSDEETRVCAPVPQFADAALGINLTDDLPDGIVFNSIEPVGASGVALGGVYVMPAADRLRLLLDAFPPTGQTPNSWRRAVPAIDAELPTDGAYDMVLRVTTGAGGGHLDGVRVNYSFNGDQYQTISHLGLTLSTEPCT